MISRSGSSPRLRGTVGRRRDAGDHLRFIPAPAGNGARPPRSWRTSPVHPRACGERSRPWRHRSTTPVHPRACGERLTRPVSGRDTSVHPRACGERVMPRTHALTPPGSSPRLRGTRARSSLRPHRHRFIPAPAGNRGDRSSGATGHRFIPAPAGNAFSRSADGAFVFGSSPRLRGTAWRSPQGLWSTVHPRACGERGGLRRRPTPTPVHPRACGEHGN